MDPNAYPQLNFYPNTWDTPNEYCSQSQSYQTNYQKRISQREKDFSITLKS